MYGSLSVLQHGKNQSDNKTKTVKLNRFKSCKNNRKKWAPFLQGDIFSTKFCQENELKKYIVTVYQ